MFRTTASRSIQSLRAQAPRTTLSSTVLRATLRTSAQPLARPGALSLTLRNPAQKSMVRYETTYQKSSFPKSRDNKAEEAYGNEVIKPIPDLVSASSSIHPVTGEVGGPKEEEDVDMTASIRSDFKTIVDTFSLKSVPKEALAVGLAGVVPYLATSLSTVYLAFDIQYAAAHGQGLLLSGEVAEQLLHIIEPIQLGYGASIISFLGAIHWGLEWAGFGGYQGYPRYSIGIVATAVAWPTLLLPAEVGLIAQFLAFTFLYYADARASTRGWAPSWYSTYRFVLTFIVGASIVASLVGRGQIADLITRPPGPADRMRAIREQQLQQLEESDAESKARAEYEESGGDEDEEEDDE
ncbi:uncharacterized protein HMPREF1541_07365 [Cyphellophora europaea CBS 101466]|uniref:Uncharacterized protein n=1 Tax=Cyphellophora europaea (strain CBS 101466) TaxID=1220924 RepID=W2RMN9_CYPE1|nr:uncharacterized protein HMPREF1541_07365 [Cyphellophora europaea CBS 101466]ETN37742.1 hypothetical protein HMPREF1541_07365 [Cyphellophora europaea CBS 101466]